MGARSTTNTSAYYLLLPLWAALVLAVLIGRRVRTRLPQGAVAVRVLAVLFIVPALLAYASLLQPGSTWQQLDAASARLRTTGTELGRLLAGRDVQAVWWLTDGVPPTAFYLLRDHRLGRLPAGGYPVGSDLWPFLVGGRPQVTTLTDTTATDLRRSLGDHTQPGDVVVLIDAGYRLLLVAHEGQVLLDAPTEEPPVPAG